MVLGASAVLGEVRLIERFRSGSGGLRVTLAYATAAAVRDQHHRPAAHLPGHWPGGGAFLGELPGHPFKNTFGDSEFVPLGPHFRQLFGEQFFEYVQFRTPCGDPFQQLGLRKSVLVGLTIHQTPSFGRDLGIELGQRPMPVLHDVVLVIKLSKALGQG